jgi:hypothetical protein
VCVYNTDTDTDTDTDTEKRRHTDTADTRIPASQTYDTYRHTDIRIPVGHSEEDINRMKCTNALIFPKNLKQSWHSVNVARAHLYMYM